MAFQGPRKIIDFSGGIRGPPKTNLLGLRPLRFRGSLFQKVSHIRLGDGIEPTFTKRMAASNSLEQEPASFKDAVPLDGLVAIL